MFTTAILTVSDKGSQGQRVDESGQVIREIMAGLGHRVAHYDMVPDERDLIQDRLTRWADGGGVDVILTTGGTGLAPRDVTPEATRGVIDREVPGLAEAMRAEGLKKTPMAMLSRAVVGMRGRTLIINLPGSPRAVREGLEAILSALPHAVETMRGEASECATREDLHHQGAPHAH